MTAEPETNGGGVLKETWANKTLPLLLCFLLTACQGTPAEGTAPLPEAPSVDATAEPVQEAAPVPFSLPPLADSITDPRVPQGHFHDGAEGLLQLDGTPLTLEQYHAVQERLTGLLTSETAADSVYLALALLDETHAPAEAFIESKSVAEKGAEGNVRARARAAINNLERAVAANPANLSALWHLAFLHEQSDDARAVAYWQQLVLQAPGHLQALARLGEGLLLLEQHAQAQLVGERALELAEARGDDVQAGRAHNVLGRAYLHQGHYQLAESMFKKAAVQTSGSRWGCAYQSLGQLYTTLGEVDLPAIKDAPLSNP